jgi:formylglycine-generating enzyme required for sulfatase activity
MRRRLSQGAWIALLFSAAVAGLLRGDPGKDAETERVDLLIQQLGADTFAKREAAGRSLEALGAKALPALRHAAAASADLEIRQRAEELVRTIMTGSRKSKSIGLEMVVIDAGEFQMGSPPSDKSRRADEFQHPVRITRPFLLGAYEVTQDEYQQVMKTNPSWFASTGGGKDKVAGQNTSRFPVESVTWYDAVEFCNRLSKQDRYETYYQLADVKREKESIKGATVTMTGGNGYRLPTEAEWEYACRARTSTPFHFDGANTGREANFKVATSTGYGGPTKVVELGRTAKVGSYAPNHWGLYDMHGNAGEWCWDWYDKDYYTRSPPDDPKGPNSGHHRVVRGGSWLLTYASCRSASRFWHTPDETNYYAGFRVARTP